MASGTFNTLYGTVAGGLIYGTKIFIGFLLPSSGQDSRKQTNDSVTVENKFNNHIETAFKKIQDWKEKYLSSCEIILAFGGDGSIKISRDTVIGGEDEEIFIKSSLDRISKFEKLADHATQVKISVVSEYGENLDYNYTKKIQDFCKNKTSITLTFKELSWSYNGQQQKHSFWIPQEEENSGNRVIVFNYLDREYQESLKKIQKWQRDNGCQITLYVDDTESIPVSDIETNPHKYLGSKLFVKDFDYSGSKISKFDKLAKDLESQKIQLTNEYGELLPYDYTKKIKNACGNSNQVILSFQETEWTSSGQKQKHSFWLPQSEKDSGNRTLVFNYQERDYQLPLEKIQKWQATNNCEITLYIDDTESIKVSDIASNPHKYLGSKLFVKNFNSPTNGKISQFEKLANDIAQERIEVVDVDGNKKDYNYTTKLQQSCGSKTPLILSFKSVTWTYKDEQKVEQQQNHYFWLPKDETDNTTLVFNYLKREYEASLAKIKKWKEDNDNCEITLLVSGSNSITISEFDKKPTDHLGSSIFVRDFYDKYSLTKISKFEKLANDLDNKKIKLINQYGENLDYSYSKKIKDSCKDKKVTLTFKEVKWTDNASKEEQKHSFWLPQGETDNKTLIFNYQERNYKDSLEKIKKWKVENNNCEITLVLDSGLLEGASVTISEILEKPEENLWSPVFVEHLTPETRDNKSSGTKISSFERLANDLDTGKIKITNNFSETLSYDYSEKIKYSCKKNNQSVTLTYQEVSWSEGGRQHTHHFWLPQGETGNRTLVFNFQERDYQDSLTKIKKWQKDNGNCEITLLIDNESISIKDFSDDPHKYLGSELFAQTLDPDERDKDGSGKKISRFDRLAKDLEMEKMSVTDEFGEKLDFEYSKKFNDLCKKDKNSKKSITLSLSTVSWKDDVNNKNYDLTLWLPEEEENKKESVFSYLNRDFESTTQKIKTWGEKVGEECEIKLTISTAKNWYATMSDILDNPRGYIGAGLFTKELSRTVIRNGVEVTERYSKMEKIVEELHSKELKITDEYGDEFTYDYSKKIRDMCKNKKTITLAFLPFSWTDKINKKDYKFHFWHPRGGNHRTQIFTHLNRDYEIPLKKIQKWEKDNNCEIEIVLKKGTNEKVTVTQILAKPHDYLAIGIFDRKIFLKDKNEVQVEYAEGVTKKYSQIDKLASDLEEKEIKILNNEREESLFFYEKKIKESCTGGKIEVHWRETKWDSHSDNSKPYQFWSWDEDQYPSSPSWLKNNTKSLKQIAEEKRQEEERKAREEAEKKAAEAAALEAAKAAERAKEAALKAQEEEEEKAKLAAQQQSEQVAKDPIGDSDTLDPAASPEVKDHTTTSDTKDSVNSQEPTTIQNVDQTLPKADQKQSEEDSYPSFSDLEAITYPDPLI